MANGMRMSTNTSNVLSVIMGGGQGTRLFPLTRDRSKPAVPLAGKYRLVDIPISNCINSSLRRIYLLTQFNSASLHRHIRRRSVHERLCEVDRRDLPSRNHLGLLYESAEVLPDRDGEPCADVDLHLGGLRHPGV